MTWQQQLGSSFDVNTNVSAWQDNKVLEGTSLEDSNLRYNEWVSSFKQLQGLPKEYLLPRINVRYEDVLTGPMAEAESCFLENPAEAARLSRMHWGYYFYLGGGLSTVDMSPSLLPRVRAVTLLRMQMINDVIEKIVGADMADSTLLDFACNWGGFAVDMGLRGLKQVTAFDFKAENIAKAAALGAYMGARNTSFEVQNVYDLPDSFDAGFDIVYNLGLLYHVVDPVKLALITYKLTRRVAVFDTVTHREPFSGFISGYVADEHFGRPGMGEYQMELHPTYRALIDLISFAGFTSMVEVVPVFSDAFPDKERDTYFQALRRTIIAFK